MAHHWLQDASLFQGAKWKQKICNVELMNYIQHCLLFFVSFKFTMVDIKSKPWFFNRCGTGRRFNGPEWVFGSHLVLLIFGCYKFQTYPPTHWHFWQECSLESTSLQKFHLNLVHLYEEAFGSGRDVQSPVIMKVHTNGRTHMSRLIKWYA